MIRSWWLAMVLAAAAGCAVFEQEPAAVTDKLSRPEQGLFFEPEPIP